MNVPVAQLDRALASETEKGFCNSFQEIGYNCQKQLTMQTELQPKANSRLNVQLKEY